MISRPIMRTLQFIVVAAVLVFVGMDISSKWSEVAALRFPPIDWGLMLGSGAVVLSSYAVLIWTWQRTVVAWGERLAFGDGARIWFISNLGRYVPGKVWQIGAMGVMAQRAGVSPVAAVGSSLVVSIVNVLTGIAVAVALGASTSDAPRWAMPLAVAMVIGVIAAPWILPVVARAAGKLFNREIFAPKLPHSAVWIAAAGCTVAWVLYGLAFRMLHIAVIGHATGDALRSTAAFTASYIAGFLFLPAPGGLGVREDALQRLLTQFGIAAGAQAWMVVFVSRIWLTILEVIPGLLLLLRTKRRSSEPTTAPTA